jgi:DNA-binding FadR family transcriptional regulator
MITSDPQPTSFAEGVYQQMAQCLERGEWVAGQRLPSEAELAQRFAVSRPVVRQALARLKAESRLFSRKGSGHYVREAGGEIAYGFGTLSNVPDVRAFLEFRCFLESEIAAQAAAKVTPEGLVEIERNQQRLREAIAAGEAGIQEDIDFHLAIARASGNRFFISTLAALSEQTRCAIRLIRELSDRSLEARFVDVDREHARILEGIASRDAAAARQAMAEHLQGGIRRLFEP